MRNLIRLNQNLELIFSNAVKNTSNLATSKSQGKSEKENQSHSSEDTNVTQFFSETYGMKKTIHRLYRPTATDTILREKEKIIGAHPPHR